MTTYDKQFDEWMDGWIDEFPYYSAREQWKINPGYFEKLG